MAKGPGFPFQIQVDDDVPTLTDISNDVTNHSFATPRGVQDITGVNKSAMERQLLLADFNATLNGVFNSVLSHAVLSSVGTSNAARTLALTLASQVLTNEALLTDYAFTRNADGSATWSAPFALASGDVPTWA